LRRWICHCCFSHVREAAVEDDSDNAIKVLRRQLYVFVSSGFVLIILVRRWRLRGGAVQCSQAMVKPALPSQLWPPASLVLVPLTPPASFPALQSNRRIGRADKAKSVVFAATDAAHPDAIPLTN